MWEIIVAIFVIAFTAFYLYVRRKMTFWERRGIPSDPGTFPFGSKGTWDLFSQKIAFAEMTDHAYKSFPDAPLVGCYGIWGDPFIVIRDLDLFYCKGMYEFFGKGGHVFTDCVCN